MPLLQGLIFDLDGTLINSAPDLRQALNRTLRAHGHRDVTLDETTGMVGDGMITLLKRAFSSTGAAIDTAKANTYFQEFLGYYHDQKPDPSQIYPYAVETLKFYQGKGVKLGLCTNKQEAATLHLLEQLDLKKYFAFIAGSDTFQVHKPDPGHVIGVIRKLDVPAEHCVMIGDGPNDVMAAHGAGIPCLAVTHGYGGDFHKLGAKGLISGFQELPTALHKLGFSVDS